MCEETLCGDAGGNQDGDGETSGVDAQTRGVVSVPVLAVAEGGAAALPLWERRASEGKRSRWTDREPQGKGKERERWERETGREREREGEREIEREEREIEMGEREREREREWRERGREGGRERERERERRRDADTGETLGSPSGVHSTVRCTQ